MEKRHSDRHFGSERQKAAKRKSRIGLSAIPHDIAERKRPEPDALHSLQRIRALRQIESSITSIFDLGKVLDVLLRQIESLLPIAAVTTVALLHRESGELELLACRGVSEKEWRSWRQPFPGGGAKTGDLKAPVTVLNIQANPKTRDSEIARKHALVSYLGVPIVAEGRVLGVLELYTKQAHAFNKKEIEFMETLGGHAALAIHAGRLYQQAVTANKIKGEFLSVMSHELRTPLTVVMGYAAMLKEKLLGEINPRQEDALRKLLGRAGDALHLIDVMLQTTYLEAHAMTAQIELFNLGELLDQMRSDYRVPDVKKDLKLIWDYPAVSTLITSDSAKLKQILQNLINNAFKFTEEGSVKVSVQVVQEFQPRGKPLRRAEFKVSDTGIGIPKDMLECIFNKFQQLDGSTTRLYGGVGLGLYIVKNFTELLGGTVRVESERGKGTTFIVTIPCGS
jgi:signal transduction histidine kinase